MALGEDEKQGVQAAMEKSVRIADFLFKSPPASLSLLTSVVLAAIAGFGLGPWPVGPIVGLALIGVPTVASGFASAPLSRLLGGTFYYRRAAFLSAIGTLFLGLFVLLALPLGRFLHVAEAHVLLTGFAFVTAVRHGTLFAIADNHHERNVLVASVPFAIALPAMHAYYGFTEWEWWLALALFVAAMAPTLLALHVFDAPMRRNFGISSSELFRYYLDHVTTASLKGEEVIDRIGDYIRAKVGIIAFRRVADQTLKAVIAVPGVHPGPVGRLGGGDLPAKVAEQIVSAPFVMVPHTAATHDFNPTSTREVERIGKAVEEELPKLEWKKGGSGLAGAGSGVRVFSQFLGTSALLTYTSWPLPIDDVDFGVGRAAILRARLAGAAHAVFVDCHNSLMPAAGAVFPCSPRADLIEELSEESTRLAGLSKVPAIRVGVAQDRHAFTREHAIGSQGVQALVVEAAGQKTAYVLWDGNNMLAEVTEKISLGVLGLVDAVQVMTTDNHSVNAVAGSFSPVGLRADHDKLVSVTRATVARAIEDLESVETGATETVVEDFRVVGHEKTAMLSSAVNVMQSLFAEILIATVVAMGMGFVLAHYVAAQVFA